MALMSFVLFVSFCPNFLFRKKSPGKSWFSVESVREAVQKFFLFLIVRKLKEVVEYCRSSYERMFRSKFAVFGGASRKLRQLHSEHVAGLARALLSLCLGATPIAEASKRMSSCCPPKAIASFPGRRLETESLRRNLTL